MSKTIDAILACRVQGARLYGKPLQTLVPGGITVLESLISYLQQIKSSLRFQRVPRTMDSSGLPKTWDCRL